MKPFVLLLLTLWLGCSSIHGYWVLITNQSGHYNTSTSLPAWQRTDASTSPAFIVADDITILLQLTRCDELVIDVTMLMLAGTTPSEPANVTFWIIPSAAMTLGVRFDTTTAVATQTFIQPSSGSWSRSGAVEEWYVGPQLFYVVTPRFNMTNVALRGNNTYWIAMLVAQERRISPMDSTFNTPRWLMTRTPNAPVGSPGTVMGVDVNGSMFRTFPDLINWSNASVVEGVAMPFLVNTATVSLTHQMSFTAYVGACYAPANVIIPSSRNFTTLPSPTAYATQTPPVTIQWPSSSAITNGPIAPIVQAPIQAQAPPPPIVIIPAPPTPLDSGVVPVPGLSLSSPSLSSPSSLITPSEASVVVISPAPIPVIQSGIPIPVPIVILAIPSSSSLGSPEDHVTGNGPTSVLTNPYSSPLFIGLLVGSIVLVVVIVVVVLIFWQRRYRTRLINESRYDNLGGDKTKEIEMASDGDVELSSEASDSDDNFQQGRVFNPNMSASALEKEQRDASMVPVYLGTDNKI
jgi:hypothetical protein